MLVDLPVKFAVFLIPSFSLNVQDCSIFCNSLITLKKIVLWILGIFFPRTAKAFWHSLQLPFTYLSTFFFINIRYFSIFHQKGKYQTCVYKGIWNSIIEMKSCIYAWFGFGVFRPQKYVMNFLTIVKSCCHNFTQSAYFMIVLSISYRPTDLFLLK